VRRGVDLHLHSDASDGLLTPDALCERAARCDLEVVALTDHDTVAGLPAALEAATRCGLRLVPAIELTCRVRAGAHGTVHVLGYGIDPDAAALARAAAYNRAGKRAQVGAIVEQLGAREGVVLDPEAVWGGRPEGGYVGRHHVAAALVRRGAVRSRLRAFRRYLRSDRVPPVEVVDAADGLAAIHQAGGLAVLAHPTRADLRHHLRPLLRLGLNGLEVYRPRATPALRERLLELAAGEDLWVTGGSDWHGHHPEPPLGSWRPPAEALGRIVERLAPG